MNFLTNGILVGPPISTIFEMSDLDSLASSNAFSTEGLHLSTIELINSSNLALVSLISRFFVPDDGS